MTVHIYGSIFSPFVKKVVGAAAAKGIAYEERAMRAHPQADFDPAFVSASPFKKMPAIRDGDYTLCDSTAICMYFDAQYPEQPLIPADPQARGKCMFWEEVADTIIFPPAAKVFFNRFVAPKLLNRPGDEHLAKEGEIELAARLEQIEAMLPADDGWLVDGRLTLADISLGAMFASFATMDMKLAPNQPRMKAQFARILALPIFTMMMEKERAVLAKMR